MNDIITKEQKLEALGVPKDKWIAFTDTAVEIMYNKFKHTTVIKKTKKDRLLYFLNEILGACSYEYIEDIKDFKLSRTDIIKFNGEKFVQTYKNKFKEWGIRPSNDLAYLSRKNKKVYGLVVLRGVCKFYGYVVTSKLRSKMIKGEKIENRFYYVNEI